MRWYCYACSACSSITHCSRLSQRCPRPYADHSDHSPRPKLPPPRQSPQAQLADDSDRCLRRDVDRLCDHASSPSIQSEARASAKCERSTKPCPTGERAMRSSSRANARPASDIGRSRLVGGSSSATSPSAPTAWTCFWNSARECNVITYQRRDFR